MEKAKKKGGGIERRILITGCNGLLGQKLCRIAARSCSVYGLGRRADPAARDVLRRYVRADITHERSLLNVSAQISPEWVVHAAALTDVERCQREPELAVRVNVEGLKHVAEACRQCGAKLLHLSSDYVFDGTSSPNAEGDRTNPLNVYGRTKEASEQFLQQSGVSYIIVRTALLYGWVPQPGRHFVTRVKTCLEEGRPVRAAVDLCGHPTLIDDLAVGILTALEKGLEGIVHMAGSRGLSRYEWALQVAEAFELDASGIEPVAFQDLDLEAPRPLRSAMKTDKARDMLNLSFRSVGEGLEVMKAQMNQAVAPEEV